MTIAFRVSIAHKNYRCDNCKDPIQIGDEYIRRFGSSDDSMKNPPPYMLRICCNCEPLIITYWHETHVRRSTRLEARP